MAVVYGILSWPVCPHIQKKAHTTHATSIEWQTRETQDVYFLLDKGTRATVYRHCPVYRNHFWDKVKANKWEVNTFKLIKYFLEGYPGTSYIDFGAWIGPTVLFAAQHSTHVYALEPDMQAFSALVANVNANKKLVPNVNIYHECINTQTGPMTFRGLGDSTSRFSDSLNWEKGTTVPEWTIPCRTLPEFVEQEGIVGLRLIKIDTEGAELYLIPSLVDWFHGLSHPKPSLWLSLHQPFWIKDASIESKEALWTAFGAYKYAYLEGTTPVVLQGGDWKSLCRNFCTYLLTDEEFVMPL